MPKSGPDSRLLENLLRAEKTAQDSFKQWTKDASAASVALSAWAVADSSETPDVMETSMRIGTLLGTCAESQRTYVDALTSYRASLKDVLMRESDIRTILRDREILVSRLITLNKKKPTDAKSEVHSARLEEAQRELGACEATLKSEEWGLVGVKRRVLRDAFGMRMRSLGELGVVLEESAKSAIELLDQLGVERPDNGPPFEDFRNDFANSLAHIEDIPPELDGEREGSIAPSHSASQVARRAAGYAASQSDTSSQHDVTVPAPHQLSSMGNDVVIPTMAPPINRRISTASSQAQSPMLASPRVKTPPPPEDSSDEEREYKRAVTAHQGGGANLARGKSSRSKMSKASRADSDGDSDATERPSAPRSQGRGFWSSFTSLFKNRSSRSAAGSDDDEPRGSVLGASGGKWKTRTDTNLKVARRNTVSGPPRVSMRRNRGGDSSDDEVDPKSLVRVVNNVGLQSRGADKKRNRSSSIAAEIYNPPLVPPRQKAMSDLGPPRPGIMKKSSSAVALSSAQADLSRSNTVTSAATTARKKKKRVVSQPTIPESTARTLAANDARWSTGTWVTKTPGVVGQPTDVLADQKTSRTYTPPPGADVSRSTSTKKKRKSMATSASAPALAPPQDTLTLPTAPPRIGEIGMPVLSLPTAPPRISALDLAPSLPAALPVNGMPTSKTAPQLAPPLARLETSSTISRRKSVRIADGTSAPASIRSPSPAPPILRNAGENGHADATAPPQPKATWSTRVDSGGDDASSDEDDQGALGFSEYSRAKKAMSKSVEGLSEKAKGKQRAE